MSGYAVGFWFSLAVLAREVWPHVKARRAAKLAARAECASRGHRWGEPFWAIGTRMRNCEHCGRQEHARPDGSWPE